jgi:hypothetical protein
LISILAAVAWTANVPFFLAVLQTLGIADKGELRGVTWEVTLGSEDGPDSLWIRVQEADMHLSWYRRVQEKRGSGLRYFWGSPWPAGIRTEWLRTPLIMHQADGTSVAFNSLWMVFFEAPLWGIVLLCMPYPILVLLRGPLRRRERRRRGWCVKCGYDLRGNVSGICPECSHPVPEGYRAGKFLLIRETDDN